MVCEGGGGGNSRTDTPAPTPARFRHPLIATVSPARFRHPLTATAFLTPPTGNSNSVLCFSADDTTTAAAPASEPSLHRGWGWGGSVWAEEKRSELGSERNSERENAAIVSSRRPWPPNVDDGDACAAASRIRRGRFWTRFGRSGGGGCPPLPGGGGSGGGGSSDSLSPVRVPASRRRSRETVGLRGVRVCGGIAVDGGSTGGGGCGTGNGGSGGGSDGSDSSGSGSGSSGSGSSSSSSRNSSIISSTSPSTSNINSSRDSNSLGTSLNNSSNASNSTSTNASGNTNSLSSSPRNSNDGNAILKQKGVDEREAQVGAILVGKPPNVDGQQLDTSLSGSVLPSGKNMAESRGDTAKGHENGGGKSGPPSGDERPTSPVLPRARVLWRAFSEVDHGKIEDNHRRAAQSHFARFSLTPVFENPPMCYAPFES